MSNQNNQSNQENSSFNDQADGKFDKTVKNANQSSAESQVRATEDASLQDDTYTFDEANTDNEEYHDAGDADDFDLDNDDDFIQ